LKEEGALRQGESTHVIACATVAEELGRMGADEERMTVLEFGLHLEPDDLREALQERIDSLDGALDVLLGYGLCSYAVSGLSGGPHRLVIPRVQDCISLFLGSEHERMALLEREPGTYFLTKGWIEASDGATEEYDRIRERYGEERARRVARAMLANYTRLALINTGNYRLDEYRRFAREQAEMLDLRYEEIPGSNRLLKKLLFGRWDGEFVVVEPGSTVRAEDFMPTGPSTG
jgi:O6-methylguanine-DNA--protein-cysteine methyltransferase